VRGDDFPGRVNDEPEEGGGGEGPDEDAPAVVAGEDAVSGNVIEGEGERGQQGGDEAVGIEAKPGTRTSAQEIDDQGDSGDGQSDGGHFLRGELLLAASHHIEQNPDRGGVLHDDGGSDVGPLDRHVVEVIRDGHAQRAQKEAVGEIARGELDSLPSLGGNEKRQEHEQRESGAGL
jgi:hypothetical protein